MNFVSWNSILEFVLLRRSATNNDAIDSSVILYQHCNGCEKNDTKPCNKKTLEFDDVNKFIKISLAFKWIARFPKIHFIKRYGDYVKRKSLITSCNILEAKIGSRSRC